MSLLDLKTDLKSLKYGNDQPGGGNSGQPYQKVDINTVDSGFNRLRMTKFDDGLVRGGVVGAANAAVVDTLRIGKFLKDFPKGPLFIVKQVGLQLSNPKLESKKGVSGFFNTEQTRIYNLGINTLAQVPVGAFGIHLNRHGLLPVQDDNTKYLAVAQFNNTEQNNRLSILRTRFNIGDGEGNNQPSFYNARQRRAVGQAISGLQLRFGIITKPKPIGFLNANKELTIDRYMGGPGSVYGIGATTLLRTAFTEDRTKIDLAIEQSKKYVSILLREGYSNLYPITANYNSSKFRSTPFDESLKDGANLRSTLDITVASNSDTGSAAIKNGVRSIDANINLREGKFLKLSNKANSDLNPEFFLDNYQKISSESDNQPPTLIGYNQVNNYPNAVLLANNSKRNISYNDANENARNGKFTRFTNYTSSSLAKLKFDNNIKDTLGLNELDKVKQYSGKTTWTPLNGSPRTINVKADLGLSNKTTSSLSLIKTKTFSSGKPYQQNNFNRFELSPSLSGSLLLNGNPVTYDGGKPEGKLITSNDLGLSKQYFPSSKIDIPRPDITTYGATGTKPIPLTVNTNNEITSDTPPTAQGRTPITNRSYQTYQKIIESRQLREKIYTFGEETVNAFGIYGNNIPVRDTLGNIIPDSISSPIYSNGKKIIQIDIPWNKVSRDIRVGSGQQDQINLTPLFENTTGTMGDNVTIGGKSYNINDLVKFRIQSINYNNPGLGKWMIFRAYITQFSDSTDATWNPVKYAGRGEDFYIYNGFTRKVSIGFKVAALSAEEMQPMYQKLNYLMSNLMPDYNNNLMNGPLVKMTIGNWLDGQDGILNNVSYTIPNDSPWEIGLPTSLGGVEPLILPHVVEVSMTFTPIGSQTKGVNKISQKDSETSHIAQNINDVQYATKFSKVS